MIKTKHEIEEVLENEDILSVRSLSLQCRRQAGASVEWERRFCKATHVLISNRLMSLLVDKKQLVFSSDLFQTCRKTNLFSSFSQLVESIRVCAGKQADRTAFSNFQMRFSTVWNDKLNGPFTSVVQNLHGNCRKFQHQPIENQCKPGLLASNKLAFAYVTG